MGNDKTRAKFPSEHVARIKQLMRTNVRTKAETAELRTLATMLHVHSGGAFNLTIDGDCVTK
jgi:thiamine biosynthesis lipoprotein ApbE